jgi:parallel beta-helix repeat protein
MKRVISILFALALVLAFSLVMATPVAAQTTYYVNAISGNDGNSGLSGHPWLTIQHAVTTVASGDIIMVAAGTYQEQVTITQSVNLIGAGEASTTIQAPTSGRSTITVGTLPWDYVVAADGGGSPIDVKIQGFTIDANGQNANASQNFAGVFFRDVGDGTGDGLYSSTIYNFGSYFGGWSGSLNTWNGNTAVTIYGNSDLTIDDNDIDDYTVSGVSAVGSNVNVTVTGNDLDGTDSGYVGLFLRDGAGTISGNNIHAHTSTNAGFGIYLYQTAAGTMIDDSAGPNTIASNRVGVTLYDTDGATIDGNTFTNSSYKSILIQEDSDNNVVKSNTISPMASALAGVDIETNCGGNVIGGDTAADGNTITLPTSGSGLLYAIWLSGTDTGAVTVKHNTVNGGQRAVQFDGGPGHSGTNTISDNTLTGAAFGGVMSSCFGNFVISGNTITGTPRPLEFWQAGNGNIVITGNTLSSTAFDAINAGSYASMVVSYNSLECLTGGLGVNNHAGPSQIVDARYNWWGDNSGPCCGATDPVTSAVATGSGESVSAYVRFDPWTKRTLTYAGTGTVSFTPDAGTITTLTSVPTPPGAPATLPYGMFSFTVTGITGQVTITVELPGPVPVGTKWWKYYNNNWYALPIDDDDGDNTIRVTLTDGASPDDADGLVNGQITDDGGPGSGAVGWETYPVSKVRVLLPWIALLAAIMGGVSLLVVRRRRAQS